ncbi:MAG: hypothetical protein ACI9K5_001621, partial [Gammaproteobacteria bacterium]
DTVDAQSAYVRAKERGHVIDSAEAAVRQLASRDGPVEPKDFGDDHTLTSEARRIAQRLLQTPSWLDALARLAVDQGLGGRGGGDSERALAFARLAVAESDIASYRVTLAWALFTAKRYEEALEECEAAVGHGSEIERKDHLSALERMRKEVDSKMAGSQPTPAK